MQKRLLVLIVIAALLCTGLVNAVSAVKPPLKLGNELLFSKYADLIRGKKWV